MRSKVVIVFVALFALLNVFQAGVAGAHRHFGIVATDLLLASFLFSILGALAAEYVKDLWDHIDAHHDDDVGVLKDFLDRIAHDEDEPRDEPAPKNAAAELAKSKAAPKVAKAGRSLDIHKVRDDITKDAESADGRGKAGNSLDGIKRKK